MPSEFPIVGYGITNAFPLLPFNAPCVITSPPGETNRLFIAEKAGRIFVITNLANPTMTLFLDATPDLIATAEAGLLGMVFHPGYSTNGYFYIYRTIRTTLDGTLTGVYDELARFNANPENPNSALWNSKLRLIAQYDNDAEAHNGGDLQFGPDGYLYVSVGDTGPSPSDPSNPPGASQWIDRHFFGTILRIDVDERPGNLAPNPYPAGFVGNFRIPADNPFIGATKHQGASVNPAKVRTELYAIGLRNPWRIRFDGDLLYCADVGGGLAEEIDLIQRGSNYGWPFIEADLYLNHNVPSGFSPSAPLHSYKHGSSHLDQGRCIVGGLVYRGTNIPALRGAYVFGDFISGRIWGLRHSNNVVTSLESLANLQGVTTFGVDPSNGDILMGCYDGGVWRLVYAPPESVPHPRTLADTGAFSDIASLTPHPGIVPYEVALPFWSDNAIKSRWFSVPDPTNKITVSEHGNWMFPSGSVWIKHFELDLTNGVPTSRRRLETRFLIKNDRGMYGLTYRWGTSRTNAWLVPEGGMEETFNIRSGNSVREQRWVYPSRSDCLRCHNPGAGYVLGFNTPQMNCSVLSDGIGAPANQIDLLHNAGYLDGAATNSPALPLLSAFTNASVPIQDRFRSYLQANCVSCHFLGGPSGMHWDARITTRMSEAGIVNATSLSSPGGQIIKSRDPAYSVLLWRISSDHGRMPPIAATVLDTNAIALVTEYIAGIPAEPWTSADIGNVSADGSASILDGSYRINSAGGKSSATEDAIHFLSQKFSGNGHIVARVKSTPNQGTGGLMIRASSLPDAACAMLVAEAGTLQFQSRSTASEQIIVTTSNAPAVHWHRLVRDGQMVRAYTSPDRLGWTLVDE
ncbi:MAG TPA: PQQ-dependent sugar dehydrogenase, partial [Candidatus Acidoferrum sp.]|nr:PQQ-dependent sugar dehydrogenase [Candidatus Acidoferrum sp.]